MIAGIRPKVGGTQTIRGLVPARHRPQRGALHRGDQAFRRAMELGLETPICLSRRGALLRRSPTPAARAFPRALERAPGNPQARTTGHEKDCAATIGARSTTSSPCAEARRTPRKAASGDAATASRGLTTRHFRQPAPARRRRPNTWQPPPPRRDRRQIAAGQIMRPIEHYAMGQPDGHGGKPASGHPRDEARWSC